MRSVPPLPPRLDPKLGWLPPRISINETPNMLYQRHCLLPSIKHKDGMVQDISQQDNTSVKLLLVVFSGLEWGQPLMQRCLPSSRTPCQVCWLQTCLAA